MGYIKDQNIELTCFLTQKGKDLYLNGSEQDITVTNFLLGDSDTNYQLASNGNVLTENFIPALSGEYNECNSSLSYGLNVKHMINKDPKGVLITSYCTTNNTLIEKYQNPDGSIRTVEIDNSPKCGFMYYSNPVSKTFTPNINPNLPFDDGSSPDLQYQRTTVDGYTVSLPYGYKTSTVSQAEADNLALNYLNTNGQSIADTNGSLTYYSSGRVKAGIVKTTPSVKLPFVYPKITLNYKSEIFNSKIFNDNNIKINKYVNDTYQNIVNTLSLQPVSGTFLGGSATEIIQTNTLGKQLQFIPLIPKILDGGLNSYVFSVDFSAVIAQRISNQPYFEIIKNIYIVNSGDYYNTQLTDQQIRDLNNTYVNGSKDFSTKGIIYTKNQLYDGSETVVNYQSTTLSDKNNFDNINSLINNSFLPDNVYDMFIIEYENSTSLKGQVSVFIEKKRYNFPQVTIQYTVIDDKSNIIRN
jgi:hypothetical protein